MRFSTLLPLLSIITSALGRTNTRADWVQPVTPRTHSHFERQIALTACVLLNADRLSAEIDVPLLGEISVGVTQQLCLCEQAGVLTTASAVDLATNLRTQGNIRVTVPVLGTVTVGNFIALDPLVQLLGPALISLSLPATPRCVYNAGAIPNSCDACTYDCPANLPIKCDRGCRNTACPTGLINTRRARGVDANLLCPSGLTACGLANHLGNRRKVECLDTKSNVEACGGCEYPLAGQAKGSDCTAIDNTDQVACVAGQCVIESCRSGYRLVGEECVAALVQQS